MSDYQCIEFSEHLEETRLIDELGWARSDGLLEDTVWAARRKVVEACDHSMPRRGHESIGDSMYWWNDQLSVLRRKYLTERRRFTRSKGDPLLRETWKGAKSALRQGIMKSRLQCWKDLIGEVEKDPSGLAFKIVTKRLVTRRKTPALDNSDRVKYIVRSLFPHVEPFQRQDRSSCVVRREELFTLEELKRAGGRLKANTAPGIDGLPNEILKEVIGVYPEILLEVFNSCLREGRIFAEWKKQRLVLLRKGNKPLEDSFGMSCTTISCAWTCLLERALSALRMTHLSCALLTTSES